jgi:peptide-methionine (R)-S-oxide reductase
MQRRTFLTGLLLLPILPRAWAAANKVKIAQFDDSGKPLGLSALPKVRRDTYWRQTLSPLAYHVTREAGTERAFSQPGYDRHEPGLYRCICCDNALFDARSKFDSGTGWPSFWQPIARENVQEQSDNSLFMRRTEVLCALCDAHLGHVFDDGPKPTGLRYCMNTVALRFIAYRSVP